MGGYRAPCTVPQLQWTVGARLPGGATSNNKLSAQRHSGEATGTGESCTECLAGWLWLVSCNEPSQLARWQLVLVPVECEHELAETAPDVCISCFAQRVKVLRAVCQRLIQPWIICKAISPLQAPVSSFYQERWSTRGRQGFLEHLPKNARWSSGASISITLLKYWPRPWWLRKVRS